MAATHEVFSRNDALQEIESLGTRNTDERSNSAAINGQVKTNAALQSGDVVKLGEHRLLIEIEHVGGFQPDNPALYDATINTNSETTQGTIGNPGRLDEVTDTGEVFFVLNRSLIVVGQDEAADIEIHGRSIAPYHAEILYKDGTYTLKHVDGSQKVNVNGSPVEEHVLEDNDVITIGDRRFVYRASKRSASPTN